MKTKSIRKSKKNRPKCKTRKNKVKRRLRGG